jgi:hypothetical protein
VPSTPKHGNMLCDLGRVKKNADALLALQRLSEDCGLDHISVNGYSQHVRSTLPDQPKNPATPFIAGGGKVRSQQAGLLGRLCGRPGLCHCRFRMGCERPCCIGPLIAKNYPAMPPERRQYRSKPAAQLLTICTNNRSNAKLVFLPRTAG